jgi:hypothetical protein
LGPKQKRSTIQERVMKITIIKKAEVKKVSTAICPWVIEDMAPSKK